MKTKNFLISGLVGGFAYYLLGWLFYGILLKDFFPQPEETPQMMIYIFLGCLAYGLFIALIFTKWAQITTASSGAKAGAQIGFWLGLFFNLFNLAMTPDTTYQMAALDIVVMVLSTALIGAIIGAVNGKIGEN